MDHRECRTHLFNGRSKLVSQLGDGLLGSPWPVLTDYVLPQEFNMPLRDHYECRTHLFTAEANFGSNLVMTAWQPMASTCRFCPATGILHAKEEGNLFVHVYNSYMHSSHSGTCSLPSGQWCVGNPKHLQYWMK